MKTWISVLVGCAFLAAASSAYADYVAVPEIDGSSAVTALSVLAGVVTLLAERLRRK